MAEPRAEWGEEAEQPRIVFLDSGCSKIGIQGGLQTEAPARRVIFFPRAVCLRWKHNTQPTSLRPVCGLLRPVPPSCLAWFIFGLLFFLLYSSNSFLSSSLLEHRLQSLRFLVNTSRLARIKSRVPQQHSIVSPGLASRAVAGSHPTRGPPSLFPSPAYTPVS